MSGEYVKETKILEKKEKELKLELLRSIIRTKNALDVANANFEYAEAELIDCYSYEIKAQKAKLDYLLREVKARGWFLDMINNIDLYFCEDNEAG